VELWYFTAEGCHNTAVADLTALDDTFGLINTDKGLVLQTIGASSTSSKVIKDEDLSWDQLMEAKMRMVGCLKACGWNKYEVSQLVLFYLSLDVHLIRTQPYRLNAIMCYQDKVWRNWVSSLRAGKPYSIAEVNNELMKEYRDDIRNEVQARNNVSAIKNLVVRIATLTICLYDRFIPKKKKPSHHSAPCCITCIMPDHPPPALLPITLLVACLTTPCFPLTVLLVACSTMLCSTPDPHHMHMPAAPHYTFPSWNHDWHIIPCPPHTF